MKKKLLYREWFSLAVIAGMVSLLIAVAWDGRGGKELPMAKGENNSGAIAVEITGAVEGPGIYYFKPGITAKDALLEVQLDGKADRRRMDGKKVLYSSQKLHVPFREEGGKRRVAEKS